MYTEKLNREERADHGGGSRGGFSRKERKGRGGEWKSKLTVEVEQRTDNFSVLELELITQTFFSSRFSVLLPRDGGETVMGLFVLDMRLMPFGHGAFSFGHGAFPF